MSLGRIYRLAVGALILGGLIVAWRAKLARQQADLVTAALTRDEILLGQRLYKLENRRSPAVKSVVETRPVVSLPPRVKSDGDRALEEMKKMRALHNDPQWQRRKLDAIRAGLFMEYGSFYQAKKLSAGQISRLEENISEHRAQMMDIDDAAQAVGLANSDAALTTLRAREAERFATTTSVILGPERAQALEEFDHSELERGVADRLTEVLATSHEPLSADHYARLVELLKNSGVPNPSSPSDPEIDWERAQAGAARFLSASQSVEFTSAAALPQRSEQIRELLARYKQWSESAGK